MIIFVRSLFMEYKEDLGQKSSDNSNERFFFFFFGCLLGGGGYPGVGLPLRVVENGKVSVARYKI